MTDEDEYEYEYVDEDEDEDEEEEVVVEGAGKKKRKGRKKRGGGKKPKPYEPKTYDDYELPPLDLLEEPEVGYAAGQVKMVEKKARVLEGLLLEFGIHANVVSTEPGPAITMYELELAPGIKVSQIANLSNDMARALSAGSVRVVAPLPGRHTIGIEAPNTNREIVRLKGVIEDAGAKANRMSIPLFLGKSSSGEALVSDLAAMPHLLIAGTTGSGKSVCINTIITSVMMTKRPDEVKLILIDPKMVEMASFESMPHLMCPTVTEMRRAEQILEWATTKMDERYELLAEAKVRNIASYNKLGSEEIIRRFQPSTPEEEAKIPKRLPHIVIIIDELADLMMTSAKEVEAYIVRIAQKSRAIGIHLVVATQRPQATVVTGLIKSNMPSRIGFRVAARMDSRIILDQNGAETLLGQGDMLFLKPGTSDLVRAQGAFVSDEEIHAIVDHLKETAAAQFHPELMQLNRIDLSGISKDDLYEDAVRMVLETGRGSVSLLQRRLGVGYARASRIIEMMAVGGLLGEYKGSQAREVTMTLDEYDAMRKQMVEDEVAGYADLADADEGDEEEGEEEEYEDEEYEEEEGDEDEEYEED
ncbi:MAG: DNA translocase FtsK [Planctomycetes bacterium]|nr:DNA translocase FtsK [Planctomycetota bacterium]